MNILKELASFFGVIGTVIVLLTFSKNFDSLSKIQKVGLVSLALSVLIPAGVDFAIGFNHGAMAAMSM